MLFGVREKSRAEPGRQGDQRGEHSPRGSLSWEGTGSSSRTGCTCSPAFPSPRKLQQQEKLCSCPGEGEGSLSPFTGG